MTKKTAANLWYSALVFSLAAAIVLVASAIVLIGVSLWPKPPPFCTFQLRTGEQRHVQAAAQLAEPRDFVHVPAGTWTWTNSVIVLRPFHLVGAGVGKTTIVDHTETGLFRVEDPLIFKVLKQKLHVKDFTFVGNYFRR